MRVCQCAKCVLLGNLVVGKCKHVICLEREGGRKDRFVNCCSNPGSR